jgi:glycosyltransferase involved in cell wall biosynthesis
MKILYLNPLILYPPLQGNQMTGLNRVKMLSKQHEITLVCFYNDKSQLDHQVEKLKKYCVKIIPVYLPKWKSFTNVASGFILSKKPLQLLYYYSRRMKKILEKADSENYDIIHVNTLRMEQFVANVKTPVLMDLHDSMILNVQSRLKKEKGLYKFLYSIELKRIKKYEDHVVEKYQNLMVLAEQDKEVHNNNSKIAVIHLGVDTETFKRYLPFADNKALIFSGNMGYTPNVDAVTWFMDNCWQKILQKVPEATFKITGANPDKQLEKYSSYKGIKITGKIESMAAAMNEAQVAIAPLWSGSGMQNKILEAMACSLPVVCTSIGLGNINAINGESVLITDDADTFSALCIELLQNNEKCKTIGRTASTAIESFYSIQHHSQLLEKLYQKIILEKKNN